MSKFSAIKFPVYGIKNYIEFDFTLDKIFTTINGQKYIVDDRSIKNNSYLSRLIELDNRKKYQRLKFDYTIRNMEELLKSKCAIGIDDTGAIYSFIIKEQFPYAERQIVKNRKKYFWFKDISYPFEVNLENISHIAENKQYYYGKLVYIDRIWYFLGFTDTKSSKKDIWL